MELVGYRNAVYLPKDEMVRLFTWDEDGNRVHIDSTYNPYLYIESKTGKDGVSLYNTPLKRVRFRNQYERSKFVRESGITRLFENIQPEPQFLLDTFCNNVNDSNFTANPLKIAYIDIETYSPGDFPNPEIAPDNINVITLYDSISEKYYTWGTKRCNYKQDGLTYVYCKSERELLVKFLEHLERDHPDVITGWNIEFFDMPYIINRIEKVLGEDDTKRLSPVGIVKSRRFVGKYGREMIRRHIAGVSILDYIELYKSFSQGLRESYKLDHIANIELGERKVDIGTTNLSGLADDDWDKFVEYNVQDVALIHKFEEKLQYLKLLRMLAAVGLTNLENALGTLAVVTGAAVIEARQTTSVKVPTFIRPDASSRYEGAYVGEPRRGFQEYIVSFDANSLYPNTMISLNLSPETKIGKIIEKTDTEVKLLLVNGKEHILTLKKFLAFVDKEDISISRAKVLFSQKKKGIFPSIVDKIYKKRVKIKTELDKIKRALAKDKKNSELRLKAEQQHILQLTLKILINRVYGYFGNKNSPMGDSDIARSITLTAQSLIKEANQLLCDFVETKTGNSETTTVLYNDTDSVYITLKPLIDNLSIPFTENGKITPEVHNLVQEIEDVINVGVKTWSENALNSKDSRFVFKRECLCDVGMFLQKKRYVLHVLDDEGIPVNKYKYTGVEVVRSTIPGPVKPHVKRIVETMLSTRSLSETNKVLSETYDIFMKLPIEDISFIMGVSDYQKYAKKCNDFSTVKRMPIHTKAAYFYNMMLSRLNLTSQYEKISNGDKVRYFYVTQPNSFGINAIGYKYYYPNEFNALFVPDTEKMFEKIIFSVIERFYESVDWKIQSPNKQVRTDLFDLFKI